MRVTPLVAPASERRIQNAARAIGDPVARLRYLRQYASPCYERRRPRWITGALVVLLAGSQAADFAVRKPRAAVRRRERPPQGLPASFPASPAPGVWPVEQGKDYEVFSNGLRVEDSLEVANEPRLYRLIEKTNPGTGGPQRSVPNGIVFHTTESDLAPFEPRETPKLQRIGRELLLFVREKRSYHFVIDRFGRVHRIVREADAANHAGHSAWADARWLYLGLNQSFLGIAFEAQTQAGEEPVNQAQVHAARVLVEMLRDKYHIPAENCVTHAQVSFNPGNNLIGWHTDWGRRFPFAAVGLPNNYPVPNPLIDQFGFGYDESYLNVTEPDLWRGIEVAMERLRTAAAAHGSSPSAYQQFLQRRYRQLSTLPNRSEPEEN